MAAFIPSSAITSARAAVSPFSAVPQAHSFLTASVETLPSGSTFEPVVPDTSTLIGFSSIVVLSAVAVYVWANQVVPVSRTNLAISKKSGPVRDYLDELNTNTTDDRDLERWLFTDWLEKPAVKGGRQKEPAIPVLKDAKWNSGDNPVLAASALIGLGVLITSVTERVASFF